MPRMAGATPDTERPATAMSQGLIMFLWCVYEYVCMHVLMPRMAGARPDTERPATAMSQGWIMILCERETERKRERVCMYVFM